MTENKKYPRIIMFSTPSCSYCRKAKQYFRKKQVPFREVDVSRDQAAARDPANPQIPC